MSEYVHVGMVLITVPNLIVIGVMILAFTVSLFVSLPRERVDEREHS